MRRIFGNYADEALALYPVESPEDIVPAFSRMLTEVGFASTARFAARLMSAPSGLGEVAASSGVEMAPAYLYQFTRVPSASPIGAFHGIEIPYVFGNLELFSGLGALGQVDYDLSEAIMGYWTRFAATGDPNSQDSPEWPGYDPSTDRHLQLGDAIEAGSGLYQEACDLADRVRGQ
jgi:para-nitrobenzyl esterase